MKKLFNTMMIASSFFIVSSCSKTDTTPAAEDVKASISVKSNDTTTILNNGTVFPDDHIVVSVTCTGSDNNKLTKVTLMASNSTSAVIDTVITGTSAIKTYLWTVAGKGTVTYTATVTGSTGNAGTATFTINVVDIISASPVLGNQASTANKRFWSAANGGTTTYDLGDVSASPNYSLDTLIDFGYCSRTTGNLIISPSGQDATDIYSTQWSATSERITNWPHRKDTKFKLTNITSSQFNAAATSKAGIYALIQSAKTAPVGGEPDLSSSAIFDTQVYLFKIEEGKYGLILVIGASGGATGGVTPGDASLVVVYED